ncbi:MAG: hypothetical protein ABEJ66_01840, partial [Candidatus Nanohaloarchaea archaeon]
ECGKHFGSGETFQEHIDIEHGGSVEREESSIDLDKVKEGVGSHLNRSFALGLVVGILVAGAGFGGYTYWNSIDHRTDVPVTVVTCDNCSCDRFET